MLASIQYTERIGAGGFGVVRRAINETDGTTAAVKILDKQELRLNDMTQNLKKEISLLTTLKHPNIVEGYAVLASKTKVFLFMEYIDGGDMHTMLSERKKFSEKEAKKFFVSLMSCLDYCHEKGIYHRDLKLENLLITKSGELKVCDFGLASVRQINNSKNELCKTIVGTEDFSPPEILKGTPYKGDKADIWSAAVILYVMLAGFCPFRGDSSRELLLKIISCKYSFPNDFPPQAKRLITAILVPDGNSRPSANDILTDPWFEEYSPRTIQERPGSRSSPRKSIRPVSKKGRVTLVLPNLRKSSSRLKESPRRRSPMFNDSLRQTSTFSMFGPMRRSTGDESPSRHRGQNLLEPHILFRAIGKANVSNFVQIYSDMLHPVNGIPVQDRRWRLKSFPKCFIGSEAVTWLAERLTGTREKAVDLGQRFFNAGAFHHVCRDHEFEDEYFFYRWHRDDPDNEYVLNLMLSDSRLLYINIRPADVIIHELLVQIMSICKSHQQLNDLMEVNIVGIQQDSLYKRYLKASRELQSCTLPIGEPNTVLVPFLINLHNLLWIQSRIHIGAYDDISYEELENAADQFEYLISGRHVSLMEVTNLLYKASNLTIFFEEDETDTVKKSRTPSKTLTRLFLKPRKRADLSDLMPEGLDDIIYFALTDGAPESPPIYAYTRGSAEVSNVTTAAREYLERVIEVDIEECMITYPRRVEVYRQLKNMVDDLEVLKMIRRICGGSELGTAVHDMMKKSEEIGETAVASMKEVRNMMQSDITFAPTFKTSL